MSTTQQHQVPHPHHRSEKEDALYHIAASGVAAIINFPLWRASAIAQSGFKLEGSNFLVRYYKAVVHPPFRGVFATMLGMTWARAAIFFGSDLGKQILRERGVYGILAQTLPPFFIGVIVQIVNMPLVRATITIQDPKCELKTVSEALKHIYNTRGFLGLYHGVSAGILKTVPKYITAVAVKDYMEDKLPLNDPNDKNEVMVRSAIKSVAAGTAGAVLTNPLDVIRNEMFKTDLGLGQTIKHLFKQEGWSFMSRGVTSNTTAVAIPIAITIFMTDIFMSMRGKLYE